MAVYFGSKGNKYFILCPEFEECYGFNMFGTLESTRGGVGSCDNWTEVDFLSFVGNGDKCEVLFNGDKSVIETSLLDCTNSIRSFGQFLGTIFTVSHKDDYGTFNQVFFAMRKGVVTKRMLEERFSIKVWKKL